MNESAAKLDRLLALALLGLGLAFIVLPPVRTRRPAAPRVVARLAPRPELLEDGRLPAVELRRVWSGFELVPATDLVTALHFEMLADGGLGYGPTWLGQRPVSPRPELVKLRLAPGHDARELAPLRSLLVLGGMMAPDASLGAN